MKLFPVLALVLSASAAMAQATDEKESKAEPSSTVKIFTTNTPLYLVDDVETSAENVKNIDPAKIKSIDILKDAKTTEKYGEKGKNGVIIIATVKTKSTLKKEIND